MDSKGLLVLESTWSDKLTDGTSVRRFLEGWAQDAHETQTDQFLFSYRMYYDQQSLAFWLAEFARSSKFNVCYIAGHGEGGRLWGLDQNINLGSLAKATDVGKRNAHRKGVLFGSCEVGGRLERFLESCGPRIVWAAGYSEVVPWAESTLCDLLFLQYLYRGRYRRGKQGLFNTKDETTSAADAMKWVLEDYPLAERLGFTVLER